MRKQILLFLSVSTIFVTMTLGCSNPSVEYEEELGLIHEKLMQGVWMMCSKRVFIDTSVVSSDSLTEAMIKYRQTQRRYDTTYYYKIGSSPSCVKFEKMQYQNGEILDNGNALYDGITYKYILRKDSLDRIHIDAGIYRDNILEHVSSDSLFLIEIDSSSLKWDGIVRYKYKHYMNLNDEYFEKKAAEDELANKKAAECQSKLKGEWYIERAHIVTDYKNGYTDENGATHIDSTIVYTDTFPAIKINCEHIPATNDNPSSYRVGTYSNGKAIYDITPSKYHIEGTQYYTVYYNLQDDKFGAYFTSYLPTQKENGAYYLKDIGYRIYDQQESSMTTERYEMKEKNLYNGSETRPQYGGAIITTVDFYYSTITEYWKRQP